MQARLIGIALIIVLVAALMPGLVDLGTWGRAALALVSVVAVAAPLWSVASQGNGGRKGTLYGPHEIEFTIIELAEDLRKEARSDGTPLSEKDIAEHKRRISDLLAEYYRAFEAGLVTKQQYRDLEDRFLWYSF